MTGMADRDDEIARALGAVDDGAARLDDLAFERLARRIAAASAAAERRGGEAWPGAARWWRRTLVPLGVAAGLAAAAVVVSWPSSGVVASAAPGEMAISVPADTTFLAVAAGAVPEDAVVDSLFPSVTRDVFFAASTSP